MMLALFALVITAAAWGRAVSASPGQETFRARIVLLTIDVQVTPSKDAQLQELAPADFHVAIAGQDRPVTSAVLLHLDEASVMSNPPRAGQGSNAECIFGFHRRVDRPT